MAGRFWRRWQGGSNEAALVKQVAALRAELRLLQAALDNQIASLDRRLSGVEDVAGVAATESRIVSQQLSDLSNDLRANALDAVRSSAAG